MPGLRRFLGEFEVTSEVEVGVMDLYVVEQYRRDGVVLIGDAFQTSSPPAGTGASRLLVDVDRLCNVHLPRWLATPGMGAEKIAQFYDDPVKRASDDRAARMAQDRRSFAVGTSLASRLRRRKHYWLRTLRRLMGAGLPRHGTRKAADGIQP